MSKLKAIVTWNSQEGMLENRILLFCFEDKCLSGKVKKVEQLDVLETYEIEVDFIDISFIQDEIVIGKKFTINEASRILSTGIIKETAG